MAAAGAFCRIRHSCTKYKIRLDLYVKYSDKVPARLDLNKSLKVGFQCRHVPIEMHSLAAALVGRNSVWLSPGSGPRAQAVGLRTTPRGALHSRAGGYHASPSGSSGVSSSMRAEVGRGRSVRLVPQCHITLRPPATLYSPLCMTWELSQLCAHHHQITPYSTRLRQHPGDTRDS